MKVYSSQIPREMGGVNNVVFSTEKYLAFEHAPERAEAYSSRYRNAIPDTRTFKGAIYTFSPPPDSNYSENLSN